MLNENSFFNDTLYHEYLNDPPGAKYTVDQQCEDLTGENGSYYVGRWSEVCYEMKCHKPSELPGYYMPYRHAALDFTTCGANMVNNPFTQS